MVLGVSLWSIFQVEVKGRWKKPKLEALVLKVCHGGERNGTKLIVATGVPSAIAGFRNGDCYAFYSTRMIKRDDHENQFGPAS